MSSHRRGRGSCASRRSDQGEQPHGRSRCRGSDSCVRCAGQRPRPEGTARTKTTRRDLQDLFDRRGVLLFRDLDLTHGEQVRLSKMLIRQEDAPGTESAPLEDKFYISNRRADSAAPFGRLQFHSDTMWADHPFEVLSLYGVDVEPPTTPTIFVSGTSAWKTLPDELRRTRRQASMLSTPRARCGEGTSPACSSPPSSIRPRRWHRSAVATRELATPFCTSASR